MYWLVGRYSQPDFGPERFILSVDDKPNLDLWTATIKLTNQLIIQQDDNNKEMVIKQALEVIQIVAINPRKKFTMSRQR